MRNWLSCPAVALLLLLGVFCGTARADVAPPPEVLLVGSIVLVLLVIAAVVVPLGIIALVIFLCRRKPEPTDEPMPIDETNPPPTDASE